MPAWRKLYHGVENMTVAVMGCVVNGPASRRWRTSGSVFPGTGEVPVAPVYVDGHKTVTLKGDRIAEEFERIVFDYVRATYGGEPAAAHLRPEKKWIGIRQV
jgi:(E)-4-hydroxy-3-methylbut-2-enyl-diphosphate synthase